MNPTCPAVAPSFANEVYPNVIKPFCATPCHSPGGAESSMPFQTYQQIYGQNGQEAGAILTQVFRNCSMPPSNAPQLPDGDGDGGAGDAEAANLRQTLLDWLICRRPITEFQGTLTKNAACPWGESPRLSLHSSKRWKRTVQVPASSKRIGPTL